MRWLKDKIVASERGAALVWVAGTLVILLTTTALATDLGWILLRNSQLQSAADSAALAGVVNLPGFEAQATLDATDAAGANGFPIDGTTNLLDEALADNSYRVELTTTIDTFFLKLIGMDTFNLSQSATAQYIKPVRLGSPDNTFGGPSNNFWAAINGRYTEIQQGDPYASECITHAANTPGCSGPTNGEYRPGGYYYGIEVAPGSSDLTVQIYDGGHYVEETGNSYAGGTSGPGDSSWRWNWPSGQRGVEVEYRLYGPDQTPTDPTDNVVNAPLHCSDKFPVISDDTPASPSSQVAAGHLGGWTGDHTCTVSGALVAGVYVLQLPSPLYEGSSKFGIRANVGSGPAPSAYGILDMSIYVNFNGGNAEPYLAEIRPEHAEKTLEVDIWDLGDVDGTGTIWFIPPDGPRPCTWTSTSSSFPSGSSATCTIDISNQRFNAEWLYVSIPLDGYTCTLAGNGCWWRLHITTTAQAHDRTTWAARVTGDPVRIVD
jgi:hypothetical protein